ncbi:MAG: hypothetical protein HKN98_17695, partial [Silicimonas sp.]|nr:hypothetical protein [Silicimonas sp.]
MPPHRRRIRAVNDMDAARAAWHHGIMTQQTFKGSFTQQEPIADDAIDAAVQVLRTGRLHRYNTAGDAP